MELYVLDGYWVEGYAEGDSVAPEPEQQPQDTHDGFLWDLRKSKREERKEARTLREIIEQAWEPPTPAAPVTEPRKPKRAVIREVMQTADLAGVQYSLAKINRLMESIERERARQAMMEDEDEAITLFLMVA